MSKETYLRTGGYLVLIWFGWFVGEYPMIPSFNFLGVNHIQPNTEILDKCTSIFMLSICLALLSAVWDMIWVRISMIFITWGMVNNCIDELAEKSEMLSTVEMASLCMALITTAILIRKEWKKRQHNTTSIN